MEKPVKPEEARELAAPALHIELEGTAYWKESVSIILLYERVVYIMRMGDAGSDYALTPRLIPSSIWRQTLQQSAEPWTAHTVIV